MALLLKKPKTVLYLTARCEGGRCLGVKAVNKEKRLFLIGTLKACVDVSVVNPGTKEQDKDRRTRKGTAVPLGSVYSRDNAVVGDSIISDVLDAVASTGAKTVVRQKASFFVPIETCEARVLASNLEGLTTDIEHCYSESRILESVADYFSTGQLTCQVSSFEQEEYEIVHYATQIPQADTLCTIFDCVGRKPGKISYKGGADRTLHLRVTRDIAAVPQAFVEDPSDEDLEGLPTNQPKPVDEDERVCPRIASDGLPVCELAAVFEGVSISNADQFDHPLKQRTRPLSAGVRAQGFASPLRPRRTKEEVENYRRAFGAEPFF